MAQMIGNYCALLCVAVRYSNRHHQKVHSYQRTHLLRTSTGGNFQKPDGTGTGIDAGKISPPFSHLCPLSIYVYIAMFFVDYILFRQWACLKMGVIPQDCHVPFGRMMENKEKMMNIYI